MDPYTRATSNTPECNDCIRGYSFSSATGIESCQVADQCLNETQYIQVAATASADSTCGQKLPCFMNGTNCEQNCISGEYIFPGDFSCSECPNDTTGVPGIEQQEPAYTVPVVLSFGGYSRDDLHSSGIWSSTEMLPVGWSSRNGSRIEFKDTGSKSEFGIVKYDLVTSSEIRFVQRISQVKINLGNQSAQTIVDSQFFRYDIIAHIRDESGSDIFDCVPPSGQDQDSDLICNRTTYINDDIDGIISLGRMPGSDIHQGGPHVAILNIQLLDDGGSVVFPGYSLTTASDLYFHDNFKVTDWALENSVTPTASGFNILDPTDWTEIPWYNAQSNSGNSQLYASVAYNVTYEEKQATFVPLGQVIQSSNTFELPFEVEASVRTVGQGQVIMKLMHTMNTGLSRFTDVMEEEKQGITITVGYENTALRTTAISDGFVWDDMGYSCFNASGQVGSSSMMDCVNYNPLKKAVSSDLRPNFGVSSSTWHKLKIKVDVNSVEYYYSGKLVFSTSMLPGVRVHPTPSLYRRGEYKVSFFASGEDSGGAFVSEVATNQHKEGSSRI